LAPEASKGKELAKTDTYIVGDEPGDPTKKPGSQRNGKSFDRMEVEAEVN